MKHYSAEEIERAARPAKAIASDVKLQVAEAKKNPIAESRRPTKEEQSDKANNVRLKHGNYSDYTLLRLARDKKTGLLYKVEVEASCHYWNVNNA